MKKGGLVAGVVSAFGQQPKVAIDEMLYLTDPANPDPNRSAGWLELYDAGQAGVDLTGWKITAHDGGSGASARRLPWAAWLLGGVFAGDGVLLVDDAGDAGGPYAGIVLPGTGTASNNQCSITGQGVPSAGAGTH